MVTNGGGPDGLFRAAFMESGSPILVGDITNRQSYYDALVAETGCSGATDTLQCLREVPYETLLSAVNQSPGIFAYQVRFRQRTDSDLWERAGLLLMGKVIHIMLTSRSTWHGSPTWMGFLDCGPAISGAAGICRGRALRWWYVVCDGCASPLFR